MRIFRERWHTLPPPVPLGLEDAGCASLVHHSSLVTLSHEFIVRMGLDSLQLLLHDLQMRS